MHENASSREQDRKVGGRYDEEGFSDDDKDLEIIISKQEESYPSTNINDNKKARPRFHEPKTSTCLIRLSSNSLMRPPPVSLSKTPSPIVSPKIVASILRAWSSAKRNAKATMSSPSCSPSPKAKGTEYSI